MYGHINIIFQSYFIEQHSEDVWDSITKQCKCGTNFDPVAVYDDSISQRIIDTGSRVLGVKRETLLQSLGEYYFVYLQRSYCDEVIRNLGDNLLDFIQSLDSIHSALTSQYPECNAPSLYCENNSSKDRILLHYYSFRRGYAHFVIGILKAVAKALYQLDLNVTITSIDNEKLSSKGASREHVVYTILATQIGDENFSEGPPTLIAHTKKHGEKQIQKMDVEMVRRRLEQIRLEYGEDALPVQVYRTRVARAKWMAVAKMSILHKGLVINYPPQLAINARRFCEVFPYHIIFTKLMKVHQCGEQLQRMMPAIRTPGADLLIFFSLINPHSMDLSYENVMRFRNTPFVLRMKTEKLSKEWKSAQELLILKGQMIELPAECMILYLASPYLRSFVDLEERNLFYADIAGHDVTRDLLFMDMAFRQQYSQKRPKPIGNAYDPTYHVIVTKGNEKDDGADQLRRELEQTQHELEEERERNALLMSYFIPSTLLDRNKSGEKFHSGNYSNVSVLFCDIVNFLQYPTECNVSSVVSLLNKLHGRFDTVTRVHDTFRVESIGDAYLVVSGIPDKVSTCTERVANTGLGMLAVCEEVKSPLSWSQNIEVRIGMHSGPIKCGIIGYRVPRLVVMGDTVTIASRMESHGEPGRIHITPAVYSSLKGRGYKIRERGEVRLRGLGDLNTYYLLSNENASTYALIGKTSSDQQINSVNGGKPDKERLKVSSKGNKVKPSHIAPLSGVERSSSHSVSFDEDFVPFPYSDNKQDKPIKPRK